MQSTKKLWGLSTYETLLRMRYTRFGSWQTRRTGAQIVGKPKMFGLNRTYTPNARADMHHRKKAFYQGHNAEDRNPRIRKPAIKSTKGATEDA